MFSYAKNLRFFHPQQLALRWCVTPSGPNFNGFTPINLKMEEPLPVTRNKGGRPKKAPSDLFSEIVTMRFTATELADLTAQAEKLNMSLSEYFRERLINGQVKFYPRIAPDEKFKAELKRLGSNMNQVALKVNVFTGSGDKLRVLWDLHAIREEIEKFNIEAVRP